MRREYINYPSNLPIEITYCSISQYPIHWHNTIEIVYVLQGNLNVSIESDEFELHANEMEIINVDEAHKFSSKNEDTEVILII